MRNGKANSKVESTGLGGSTLSKARANQLSPRVSFFSFSRLGNEVDPPRNHFIKPPQGLLLFHNTHKSIYPVQAYRVIADSELPLKRQCHGGSAFGKSREFVPSPHMVVSSPLRGLKNG